MYESPTSLRCCADGSCLSVKHSSGYPRTCGALRLPPPLIWTQTDCRVVSPMFIRTIVYDPQAPLQFGTPNPTTLYNPHIHIYYVCAFINIYIYIHMYGTPPIYICTCVYIYTYIYARVYTYISTYTQIFPKSPTRCPSPSP